MNRTVIIDACRTPIGKFGGSLAGENAVALGTHCLLGLLERVGEKVSPEVARQGEEELLKRKPYFREVYPQRPGGMEEGLTPAATLVEEAIIGNVLSAGLGQNPARQIVVHSGISRRVPASTVNQVCASGMKAVVLADHMITSGVNTVMVAGGTESMSQAPYLLRRSEKPRLGSLELEDTIMRDGLSDAFHDYPMGVTAENLARGWEISREQQDEYAYHSQRKAAEAEKQGRFLAERIPYLGRNRAGEVITLLDHDEFIRTDVDLQKLSGLKPVFASDEQATVTAGNASGVNDGASFLYLMEEKQAQEWGIKPLATITASVTVAIDETVMGYTPKTVITELLRRTGLSWEDLSSVEINEAFAAQSLAVLKGLGITPEQYHATDTSPPKVNPWGGAIALGHPIGCSGARIITTLAHTLQGIRSQSSVPVYGIAALCVGGGQGCGVVLEV